MTPSQQARYNLELAKDILSFIISQRVDAIKKEKGKGAVESNGKVAELMQEIEFYTQEQDAVISNDAAAIQRVMDKYYPEIKAAYDHHRTAPISAEERRRRQEAFNYARASVGLEGIKVSKKCEKHALRFINGEIDMPTFKAWI